jgi:hypothetical protein
MHHTKMKAMQAIEEAEAKEIHIKEKKESTARQSRPNILFYEAFSLGLITKPASRDAIGALVDR